MLETMFATVITGEHGEFPVAKKIIARGAVGRDFVDGFLQRNPSVKIKGAKSYDTGRADLTAGEVLDHFKGLQEFFGVHGIDPNNPAHARNIWNLDEVRSRSTPELSNDNAITNSPPRVLAQKHMFKDDIAAGSKFVGTSGTPLVVTEGGVAGHVSLLPVVSADGYVHAVTLMYALKLSKSWMKQLQEPHAEDSAEVASMRSITTHVPTPTGDAKKAASGGVSASILLDTVRRAVTHGRSVGVRGIIAVIVDGHASRLSLDLLQWCIANDVRMWRMAGHSSHVAQPLDLGFFSVIDTVSVRTPCMCAVALDTTYDAPARPVRVATDYRVCSEQAQTKRTQPNVALGSDGLACGYDPCRGCQVKAVHHFWV